MKNKKNLVVIIGILLLAIIVSVVSVGVIYALVPTQDMIRKNEKQQYEIVLENSDIVRINERYEKFIPYISDKAIKKAIKNIEKDSENYTEYKSYYLSTDAEGYLCLSAELIHKLTEEEWGTAGCYDHRHIFFSERISNKAFEEYREVNDYGTEEDENILVNFNVTYG